jgi:glycosyltransferase involved in cell wall biosynthesis
LRTDFTKQYSKRNEMTPKIHFHSDCSFFAGSENMLAVFFNNGDFWDNFEFSLSYNYSEEYEEGLNRRIKKGIRKYPLELSKPASTEKKVVDKIIKKIFKPLYFLSDVYRIYNVIKKENPDLVHINNGGYPGALSCSAAVLAAKLAKKNRILYVVNNIAFPIDSLPRAILYPLDVYLRYNVSKFITGSKKARESLKSVLKLKDEQIVSIPNTIIPKKPKISKEAFRKMYGVGTGDIIVACVALFQHRKGHKYLIDAFAKTLGEVENNRKLFLFLDGWGQEQKGMEEQIEKLGIKQDVIITNSENIYDLYHAMDFLVVPSIEKEDFPNVILEAMSCGKAVVGTDIGGIPEQVIEDETGYIVKPKDVEELANAMKKLINDPKLADRLGKNGNERFEKEFSEDIVVKRYIELWNKTLGCSNAPIPIAYSPPVRQ